MAKYVLAAGLGMPTLADRAHAVDVATALLPHRLAPATLASAMAELRAGRPNEPLGVGIG